MSRSISCIDSNIRDIITSQGFDAFIDIGGTLRISMETDIAEVGLHKAWLQVRDTHGRIAVSATSIRNPSESAFTAAFVAQ